MKWVRDIFTGNNNETVSVGRALGITVFFFFIVLMPFITVVTIVRGILSDDDWVKILGALQIYVPAILLSVGGLIGLTAPSEPKSKDDA